MPSDCSSQKIVFQGVCKKKPLRDGQMVEVLCGVDLKIEAGQYIGVLGASGSGKSTMLRLMNRLEDPDAGSIHYGDKNINELNILNLRRRIALVLQKPVIFPGTVIENVMIGDILAGESGDEDRACRWLKFVKLPGDLVCRDAASLSVGQQARVQLARALYLEPEVILLDECTANLDVKNAEDILYGLEELFLKEKRTIVHVSHQPGRLKLCRYLIYLENGKIVASGKPADILENPGGPAAKILSGHGGSGL